MQAGCKSTNITAVNPICLASASQSRSSKQKSILSLGSKWNMRAEISILSNIYLQESSRLSTTVLLIPALHLARDSKITLRKNGEGSQKPKVKPKANYKDA